jgi:NADP-dependent 3-hydroxy acid dehydrogenase YdfG
MTTDPPLAGRVGVVTGASAGIGAATAQALAAAGMTVVLGARRAERLAAVCAAIEAAGGRALAVPADVRDEAQVDALIDAAAARFGRLDALVNNAAVGMLGTVAEADTAKWRATLDTNVLGVVFATRAALRHMLPSGRGDIVTLTSAAMHGGWPYLGAYAASKAAVAALARSLRAEVAGRGVRVMTIEVHQVASEFGANLDPALLPSALASWKALGLLDPAGVVLAPADVARAVVFQLTQPDPVSVHDLTIRPRTTV